MFGKRRRANADQAKSKKSRRQGRLGFFTKARSLRVEPLESRQLLSVVSFEGFEGSPLGWEADNAVWEIGVPTAGPASAFEGTSVAGTNLDGDYPDETDSRLISSGAILPTVTGAERVELRFQEWYSYASYDSGTVQLSVWDGADWGEWFDLETSARASTNSDWAPVNVDLTAYAGENVRLAFFHEASRMNSVYSSESTGWYIDNVEIWEGVPTLVNPETLENGWGDWDTTQGVWEIGSPTAGPTAAFEGTSVAGTNLDGDYPSYTDSRLVSPGVMLPTVTGTDRVELRFQEWYSYSTYDSGTIQLSVWDGGDWGEWFDLESPARAGTNGDWAPVNVDLTAYAGENVRVAFLHEASRSIPGSASESTGWYIDNVEILPYPPVGINIAGASITEGDSGVSTADFVVTLDAPLPVDFTVDYLTADDTATAGSDYTQSTGTLTIPAGQTAGTISVSVIGDTTIEADEAFAVTLSNSSWDMIGTTSAIGTILNDDIQPIGIGIASVSIAEGDSGVSTADFVVTLSESLTSTFVVSYATSDGTATAGSDYESISGELTIPAGQTSGTISVSVYGDLLAEGDETFSVVLSNPTHVVSGTTSAIGTILSDDTLYVEQFMSTPSGFDVLFSRELDTSELNLYDGVSRRYGDADVTLIGDTLGQVAGSFIIDADNRTAHFVADGGILVSDTYTVTLASGTDAFQDLQGQLLDGNRDDIAGDDYSTFFSVINTDERVVSLPDLARGPGQAAIPIGGTTGIPLSLNNGEGVFSVDITMTYDSDLLDVTGFGLSQELSSIGWLSTVNLGTPGVLVMTVYGTTVLSQGPITLGDIEANVPVSAPYGDGGVLHFDSLAVNEDAFVSIGDDAVHVVAYIGDATGNHKYSGLDSSFIARASVGLDDGFDAYPLKSPVIIADVTGNGTLSGLDAAYVAQKSVGLTQTKIPDLPDIVLPDVEPIDPVVTVGNEPSLAPDSLTELVVTIGPDGQGGTTQGLLGFDLTFSYDTQYVNATAVTAGAVIPGWTVIPNIDDALGQITVTAFGINPLGDVSGPLLNLTFESEADAPDAWTTGVLVAGELQEGEMLLTPVHGSITISAPVINTAPTAVDDPATTNEDSSQTIDVLGNDTDPEFDTLTIDSFTQPTSGVVTQIGEQLVYAPQGNFFGMDSFTYTITDGEFDSTATVSVTVEAVNDPPVAEPDNVTTHEDVALTVNVLGNDTDLEGDSLTIDSFTQPTSGVVTQSGQQLVYDPQGDFNGSDSFTYTITDGDLTSTATVSITVDAVNDAPIAENDSPTTQEDTSVTVDVLINDSDVDGDTLTIDSFTQPASGVVTQVGQQLAYDPQENFNGSDAFTYTITDGNSTSTATVSVTVDAVNDTPDAIDDLELTRQTLPVTINVLDNDVDPDNDTLSIDSFAQPTNGVVTQDGQGLVYTPNQGFSGADSFTYTVSDGLLSDTATVNVTVESLTMEISGPTLGVRNQPLSYELTATGGVAGGSYAVSVDFGDGTPEQLIPFEADASGNATISVEYAYPEVGDFAINATVPNDSDGAAAQLDVSIGYIELIPVDDSQQVTLHIGGSSRHDGISVIPRRDGTACVYMSHPWFHEIVELSSDTEIFIYGGDGNDFLRVDPRIPNAVTIFGGNGNDFLHGASGNDHLDGGAGWDHLFGNDGNDQLEGGSGTDFLHGGRGDDTLLGGTERDHLYAGSGNDLLDGGTGNDFLFGHQGNDILIGSDGDDRMFGGMGDDILIGSAGRDHLFGGLHDDLLVAGGSNYDGQHELLREAMAIWTSSQSMDERIDEISSTFDEPQDDNVRDNLFGSMGDDFYDLDADDWHDYLGRGDRKSD